MPLDTSQLDSLLRINVTHFSTFESGGAGVRHRIHRSLVDHEVQTGIQSRLRVIYGCSQDQSVVAGPAAGEALFGGVCAHGPLHASTMASDGNSVLHSTCWPDSGVGKNSAFLTPS